MINDIEKHIAIINESITWATKYEKKSFPFEIFKEYRRKLKKIHKSLSVKCSAAAYGESQVGKSYLMNSLLSAPELPFVITNNGTSYSFIDDLNPSGGNNTKVESTGVITRFTIQKDEIVDDFVKINTLSVVDIVLLIVDSYYNDIKINPDNVLKYDDINKSLENLTTLWISRSKKQNVIQEDDIKDIFDYIKEVIGNNASNIYQSNFKNIIAPNIQYVDYDKWVDVFSILWNKNEEMTRLFSTLINEYQKLNFITELYVPFDAVLREKGTLLKIEWLDNVCGVPTSSTTNIKEELVTDVFDVQGNIITRAFSKGYLSALIAELTFTLPKELLEDRMFLDKIDLLDFPGARSREKYKEQEIHTVLPKILRRGKVAYLFNKYSRSLQISSLLFCHHNDQKTEPTIGETINEWINSNIGSTPEKRVDMLSKTNGIAPLFMIATKFNIDLERTKTDRPGAIDKLNTHWNRFDTVFPEIIKPNTWFDQWVKVGGMFRKQYFQNIYPLRDFYWSGKNGLFDGYSDGEIKSPEKSLHIDPEYPEYMDDLRMSFINNDFVQKHFSDAEQTWNNVATVNNDGSKAIISSLNTIADFLQDARKEKYLKELEDIKHEINQHLSVYYEPEDDASRNMKVKKISGDIRRSLYLTVATKPEIFGKIIDVLMINAEDLRNIAYDIIICKTETPKDFTEISFLRKTIGLNPSDKAEVNIAKLCEWGRCNLEELESDFESKGFTVEDVIYGNGETLTTVADVITKHIVDYWQAYINNQSKLIESYLPHAEDFIFMYLNLFNKLNIRQRLSEKINSYTKLFEEDSLPNVISGYTSLILNNFISNVGQDYIEKKDFEMLKSKADICGINIDLNTIEVNSKPHSLIETLTAFDNSENLDLVDIEVLRKLPLWDSFQRWESLVTIGLLYASDISKVNPEANSELNNLIVRCNSLYL